MHALAKKIGEIEGNSITESICGRIGGESRYRNGMFMGNGKNLSHVVGQGNLNDFQIYGIPIYMKMITNKI